MSELRTEFERLHPVPVTLRWDDVSQQYACKHWSAEHAEIKWNSLWQGFQSGHAAGLEQQAKRIAELESSLADAIEGQQIIGMKMIESDAKRLALEAQLADSDEALQVLGLKLAQAEGHSASAVVGPTPVTVAAPACEQPLHHVWGRDGEHCTLCGDPDWCAGPICAGARCMANFELSRKDREHIAEYMTNHNKLRSEVGLKPVTDISEFLGDKVMTDIRTELQTMRSSGRFASCSNEDTRTTGESDRTSDSQMENSK